MVASVEDLKCTVVSDTGRLETRTGVPFWYQRQNIVDNTAKTMKQVVSLLCGGGQRHIIFSHRWTKTERLLGQTSHNLEEIVGNSGRTIIETSELTTGAAAWGRGRRSRSGLVPFLTP